MSSIGDNIDALIENIKISEHFAESQRNELNAVEIEISRIKSEMAAMSLEKEEVESEYKKLLTEVNKQVASVMSLEKEVQILKDVHKELKDTYDRESSILSEKQQEVWKKRELFCNNLHQFAEDWGPLSTKQPNKNKSTLSEKGSPQESEESLENDLKTLRKSVEEAKEKLSGAEKNLNIAKSFKEKLSEEPEWGEEFVSLQSYLRQVQLEVEVLEKQCENAKEKLWKKPKNRKQVMFLTEPPLTHLPIAKTAPRHAVHDNSFSGFPERSQRPIIDKNSSWNESSSEVSTIKIFGVKRPVAAVAPAIDLCHQETEDDSNVASQPKKSCSFIPKKPSSLSKKFLTHSSGWVQLEKELSELLRKDL